MTSANVEFSQYGELFRRRWRLVVLGVVAGLGLAIVALLVLPKTYESTASVLVAATGDNGTVENGRTSTAVNLDTEAQIVSSSVVSRLAGKDLKSNLTPREQAKKVSVSVPANTSVLDITYAASSPAKAQLGARAFAEAYLANRQDLAEARIDQQRIRLQSRIDSLNTRLEKIGEQIQNLPANSAARAFQESRRELLVRQLSSLNEQLVQLESQETTPGAIITDPQRPSAPTSPNVLVVLASGLLTGLLFGLVLAILVDRRDHRIRDRRDLERIGLDPLVPLVAVPPPGEIASALSTQYDAESMRMLRNSLLAQMPRHRGSVMVAAASPGTAGSAVALNLAATLARSGLEVILASAASHAGNRAADSQSGLADVIDERVRLDDVLRKVDGEPGLRTLPPGLDGSLYSELVQSKRLEPVMDELTRMADVLVVDVAPISENADAQTLASQFDGVVLVATAKRTTLEDMVEAVDQLRHVSARVFGAVVARQSNQGSTVVVEQPAGDGD